MSAPISYNLGNGYSVIWGTDRYLLYQNNLLIAKGSDQWNQLCDWCKTYRGCDFNKPEGHCGVLS